MDLYIFILNIARPGGTERAASNLANILSAKYHVCVISFCSTNKDNLYFYLKDSIDVLHLGMPELSTNICKKIKWFYLLHKKVNQLKFANSILLGTGHNINVLLPFLRKRKKNVRVVGCEHIQLDSIPWFNRLIVSFFYSFLDAVVVLSHGAEKKIKHHLIFKEKVFIIPNSLSFLPEKSSTLLEKRIIMVGRLSLEKGYERVVKIASFLKENYPEWKIEIFGDGALKDKLSSLYNQNQLSNIKIHSSVSNIMQEYIDSSIFMMTSHSEAMPMVILEANICGLPVIAFECEGTKELVQDNINGFLIKKDDYTDFKRRISLMISDYNLRQYLGEGALKYSQNYHPERILKLWKLLIDKMNRI